MLRFVSFVVLLPLMLLKGAIAGLVTALHKLQRPRNPLIELEIQMDYAEPHERATAGGGLGTAAVTWRTPAGREGATSEVTALRALSVAALYAKVLSIDPGCRNRLFGTIGGAVVAACRDRSAAFGFPDWELRLSDPGLGELRLPVWPWRLLQPGSRIEPRRGPTFRTYLMILGEDQERIVSFLTTSRDSMLPSFRLRPSLPLHR
jgi:hypothetical protein